MWRTVFVVVGIAGCSTPQSSKTAPSTSASAGPDAGGEAAAVVLAPVVVDSGAEADSGADSGTGTGTGTGTGREAGAAGRAKVVTIGMHVGGGPYDEITKEPLKKSVEPRFADLLACWGHAPPGTGQIDAGVDLVVEAGGGKARVSNPRSLLKNDAFVACVVTFFESVEFLPPKNGRTTVSYSVRFVPKR